MGSSQTPESVIRNVTYISMTNLVVVLLSVDRIRLVSAILKISIKFKLIESHINYLKRQEDISEEHEYIYLYSYNIFLARE